MAEPTISIIVPVYKTEAYLENVWIPFWRRLPGL